MIGSRHPSWIVRDFARYLPCTGSAPVIKVERGWWGVWHWSVEAVPPNRSAGLEVGRGRAGSEPAAKAAAVDLWEEIRRMPSEWA